MRLNHLNLPVDDLTAAIDIFRRCFDFRLLEQKGAAVAVLSDGHGFVLVLSSAPAFGAVTPTRYPEGFHVGFVLDGPDQVDLLRTRLAASGIAVGPEPRRVHGAYAFYFTALEGLLFEVSCSLGPGAEGAS